MKIEHSTPSPGRFTENTITGRKTEPEESSQLNKAEPTKKPRTTSTSDNPERVTALSKGRTESPQQITNPQTIQVAPPQLIFPASGEETHGTMLDLLGRQIAVGRRTPGTIMTLAELEKDFCASRTVVREAIKVLESLGMVAPRRRVGITILPRKKWHLLDSRVISWRMYDIDSRRQNLLEINSLRRGLEPEAARLAALRQPQDANKLLNMAARMRELGLRGEGASAEFLRTDIEFHELITVLSGNEIFAHLGAMIGSMLIERTHWNMQPDFPDIAAMEQHMRLAQAIRDGNQEVAQTASSFIVIQADDEVRSGTRMHITPELKKPGKQHSEKGSATSEEMIRSAKSIGRNGEEMMRNSEEAEEMGN